MPERRIVDCSYVEERVQQFLDGELDDREADELRLHLDACAHCIDRADLIEAYRRLVRRSCSSHAPESLRMRIVAQIHTVQATRIEIREV